MAAIEVRSVGKRYWQLEDKAMLIKSIMPFLGPKRTEHWALRDIELEVDKGETVGVLGRNGAGKTTLLRLLAGVTRPTEGGVTLRGRVSPLISVGVGFHQEMSGRENVFVNGMLLGLTKREVARRFDEIVDFAELHDFIDTPVKFYSSGMFMRLGFAVAAHVEPEILLVDEVLAVGDTAFQLKCFERMRELQHGGTSIVIVSHSMHAIRLLCPRAILLSRGHLEFDGPAEKAIARHYQLMTEEPSPGERGVVTIRTRELVGPDGPTNHPNREDLVTLRAAVHFGCVVDSPQVYVEVVTETGIVAYCIGSIFGRAGRTYAVDEIAMVEMSFRPRLGPGTYRLVLMIFDRHGRQMLAHDPSGCLMYIAPRPGAGGVADLSGSVSIDDRRMSDLQDLLLSSPTPGPPSDPSDLR